MMTIPVNSYTISLANGTITMLLPTNTTGSYYGQIKGLNTDEVSLYALLEVSSSQIQQLQSVKFDGVNVISFQEQITGSTIRPILVTQAPIIHQRAMDSDGIVMKLRSITLIELSDRDRYDPHNYIEFK